MMAKKILWSGAVVLPSPVSISVNDEIIWTSDTGRTLSGKMVGDPVAEKKTVSVKWGTLTEAEMLLIKNTLTKGYFPISSDDRVLPRYPEQRASGVHRGRDLLL